MTRHLPTDVLGVPPDADEREIKRAYARLLKTRRPDDDPAGSQSLHETFEAALRRARQLPRPRVAGPTAATSTPELTRITVDESIDLAPPGNPPPSAPERAAARPVEARSRPAVAEPPFSIERFVAELKLASEAAPAELAQWLQAHPQLYSLSRRRAVREPLMLALIGDPPSPNRVEVILQFFDIQPLDPDLRIRRLNETLDLALRQRFRAAPNLDFMYSAERAASSRRPSPSSSPVPVGAVIAIILLFTQLGRCVGNSPSLPPPPVEMATPHEIPTYTPPLPADDVPSWRYEPATGQPAAPDAPPTPSE